KAAGGTRGAVLTRRGITLRVLLRDGLLEPARGVLSIYYLGKKFVGDLGADGTITWQETGQVFNSPSAWATHCKRLVNPAKKSGCGWASVRYKGQKLDQYKAAWLRKHQPNAPPAEEVALCCSQSLASEGEEEEMPEEEEEEATREGRAAVPEPVAAKKLEEKSKKQQCKSLAEPAGTGKVARGGGPGGALGSDDGALCFADHGPPGKRLESKPRVPVRYCTLGTRDSASLFLRGLSLVGWYHSHPFGPALPSLHDIDAQMDYQLKLQGSGNGFQPCLALICGEHPVPAVPGVLGLPSTPPPSMPAPSVPIPPTPGPYYHGNPGVESKIAPFWVMPPPEQRPNDYGIPMDVEVAYIQDGFLTNDVLQEMTLLVEFYKGAPDLVKFQEVWSQDQTYLDKLKGSLASRTPKDQSFTHILEQIYSLLKLSS
ncbi:MPND protein, partial [Chunga burmeisteri]|nr:MPND protein [Chunga burmeisteri]